MTLQEIDEYLGNQRLIQVIKDDRKKEEKKIIDYVKSELPLVDILTSAAKNKMIPLVFSSKESYINLQRLIDDFKDRYPLIFAFDLRMASTLPNPAKRDNKGHFPPIVDFYKTVKHNLAQIMAKGGLFIVNMDDSLVENPDMPDPDPKEYFIPSIFPSQIFRLNELSIPEVFSKVTDGTQFAGLEALNSDLRIIVWSKIKIEMSLTKEDFMRKVEKRFSHVLPLKEMNYLVYNPPKK